MHETNIYDLTEQESASIGVPHTGLLIEALTAICDGHLAAQFGNGGSTIRDIVNPVSGPYFTYGSLIRDWIIALKRDPRFSIGSFRSVFVKPQDYNTWRKATAKKNKRSSKGKPGAKLRYDWNAAEVFIRARMDHHGDFDLSDPDWRSQADAEKALTEWFEERHLSPSESIVRLRIVPMIQRWREGRS
jgi:hypothetical protein